MRANNPQQGQGQGQMQGQMQGQQQKMGGRMGQQQQLGQQEAYAHLGDTQPMMNHDHDLIHELSDRLDAVWRYDQFIANAEDRPQIQQLWRDVKQQDLQTIERLKECIKQEVKDGCF